MKKPINLLIALCICSLFFSCDVKKDLEDIEPTPDKELTRVAKLKIIAKERVYRTYDFEYDTTGNLLGCIKHLYTYADDVIMPGDSLMPGESFRDREVNYSFIKKDGHIAEMNSATSSIPRYNYQNYINGKPTYVYARSPLGRKEVAWEGDKLIQLKSYWSGELMYIQNFTYNNEGNIIEREWEYFRTETGGYVDSIYITSFEYDDKYNFCRYLPLEINIYDFHPVLLDDENVFSSVNNIVKARHKIKLKSTGQIIDEVDENPVFYDNEYVVDDQNRVIIHRELYHGREYHITYKTFTIN